MVSQVFLASENSMTLYLEVLEGLICLQSTNNARDLVFILSVPVRVCSSPWCCGSSTRYCRLVAIAIALSACVFGTSSVNQRSRIRATFQLGPHRRTPERALCLPARSPATIIYLTTLGLLSPLIAALVCLVGRSIGFRTSSRLASGARGRHALLA